MDLDILGIRDLAEVFDNSNRDQIIKENILKTITVSKFWKKNLLPGKFRKIDKVEINLITPYNK